MAEYGAMIDVNGNPFITPNSTPFALYTRSEFNSYANGNTQETNNVSYIDLPADYPVSVFCRTEGNSSPAGIVSYLDGRRIRILSNSRGSAYKLIAYVFAIFPQTLPRWGMAIWNASGELILTNETKVLSDLETVPGGININTSKGGAWASSGGQAGSVIILVPQPGGGSFPQSFPILTGCRYDGTNTYFQAFQTQEGQTQGYTDNGTSITVINTANYD